jgi:hypothetical protein
LTRNPPEEWLFRWKLLSFGGIDFRRELPLIGEESPEEEKFAGNYQLIDAENHLNGENSRISNSKSSTVYCKCQIFQKFNNENVIKMKKT